MFYISLKHFLDLRFVFRFFSIRIDFALKNANKSEEVKPFFSIFFGEGFEII